VAGRPVIGLRGVLGKMKLPVERVLHIDHLLLMQGLNTYEAKTEAKARIKFTQVLLPADRRKSRGISCTIRLC